MKTILAILALIAIACLGQNVRPVQETHVDSITAVGIKTTGTATVNSNFSFAPLKHELVAPDDPVVTYGTEVALVAPGTPDLRGAPSWRPEAPDNPGTMKVSFNGVTKVTTGATGQAPKLDA